MRYLGSCSECGAMRCRRSTPPRRRLRRPSLVPLEQLAGESHVGVGDAARSFDAGKRALVGIAVAPHEVGDGDGGASADTLGTVHEDASAVAVEARMKSKQSKRTR